jgi:hypothetical protein
MHGLFDGLPGKAGVRTEHIDRGLPGLGRIDFQMAFETPAHRRRFLDPVALLPGIHHSQLLSKFRVL